MGREKGYKNIKPPKPGEKRAEKWTPDTVLPILTAILDTLKESDTDTKNIVRANDIKLAGEVRLMHGVTKQQWSEWKEKFKENDQISDLLRMIDEILECRLIYSGTRMDEFVLKNKYGYVDKLETKNETTVKGSIPIAKWIAESKGNK